MMSLHCFLQAWGMLLHMKARIVFDRVLIHLLHVLSGNARASSLSKLFSQYRSCQVAEAAHENDNDSSTTNS